MSLPVPPNPPDAGHFVEAQSTLFYKLLDAQLETMNYTAYPMKDKLVNSIKECVQLSKSGVSASSLRKDHNFEAAYLWLKKYDIVTIGDHETLIYKATPNEDGELPALDSVQKVSCYSMCFDDICSAHIANNCHTKSRKLFDACKSRYGVSIPFRATELLVQTCPVCCGKKTRSQPKAGFRPIITRGFGERGCIDLIDCQSMPDGPFNWIINYTDHGIKVAWLGALVTKQIIAVAWWLFCLFTKIGPPAILQSDNGREFNGMAFGGKCKKSEISDEVRTRQEQLTNQHLPFSDAPFLLSYFCNAVLGRCHFNNQGLLACH